MAEVVQFHHVLGLTHGVCEFAERLAGETHRVQTPDLYEGAVGSSLDDGFAIKDRIGDIPIDGEWAFGPWPDGLPVQVHGMDDDEFFAHEGDLDAARELVTSIGPGIGEVFTYPGDRHLFLDSSLPTFDAEATALVVERSRAFLGRLDGTSP